MKLKADAYSLPVVGGAGEDSLGAVDLFEGDDEGEFVLEGLGTEGPEEVGAGAGFPIPAFGAADEEGDFWNGAVPEFLDFGGEGAAGECGAALVEQDAVAAIRKFQHAPVQGGSGFDEMDFGFARALEAGEVVLDAEAGEFERGLAGGEDFPGQRWTGLKSAAW